MAVFSPTNGCKACLMSIVKIFALVFVTWNMLRSLAARCKPDRGLSKWASLQSCDPLQAIKCIPGVIVTSRGWLKGLLGCESLQGNDTTVTIKATVVLFTLYSI